MYSVFTLLLIQLPHIYKCRYHIHFAAIIAVEKELKSQNVDDFEYHLLSNFASLARKQKNDAEYVLAEFMKLLSDERYVRIGSCNRVDGRYLPRVWQTRDCESGQIEFMRPNGERCINSRASTTRAD